MWLNGGIDEVSAMTETFIKSRKHNLTGKVEPVGIDDASLFLARFDNGSLATFEATRYARGHKALYTFEINGEHASIFVGPARPAPAAVFRSSRRRALRGWRSMHITDRRPSLHEALVGARTADRLRAHVHPPGRRFSDGGGEGKSASPTFRDGLAHGLRDGRGAGIGRESQWVKVRGAEAAQGG